MTCIEEVTDRHTHKHTNTQANRQTNILAKIEKILASNKVHKNIQRHVTCVTEIHWKNRDWCCQKLQAAFDPKQQEIKIYTVSYTYTHVYAYLETCIHVYTYVITTNPLGLLNTVVDKKIILSLQMAVHHGDSWIAKSQYPRVMKLTTIIVVYQIHKPVCRLPRIRR